jgi:hypothetical protein
MATIETAMNENLRSRQDCAGCCHGDGDVVDVANGAALRRLRRSRRAEVLSKAKEQKQRSRRARKQGHWGLVLNPFTRTLQPMRMLLV